MTLWTLDEIRFELVDDQTSHPIATLWVDTPEGRLVVMAEVKRGRRRIELIGLHVHGEGVGANQVGPGNLRRVAQAFMEVFDVGSLVVRGGVRTTGASPGAAPRLYRFTRRVHPDLGGVGP